MKIEIEEGEKTGLIPNYVFTGEQLLSNKIDEIPTLLEPIFPKVGLATIAGSSDTGKSSLLRQMAMAIVSGEDEFLGFRLNVEHRSAIYISTEDDELALSYLLNKQNNGKYADAEFKDLRYIFESEDVLGKIEQELQRQPADCVFVDAFSDLYDGEMNQTNKIRTFLNKYADVAKKYKCLIIFLHHCGKRTEETEPSKNNLLGSQGFEAKMRLVIELRKDYSYPAVRHFCIVKGNYLQTEYKEQSYALEFDQNMLFHDLDRRTPFAMLSRQVGAQQDKSVIKEKVQKYKEQGLSTRKISEVLKEEGIQVGKSAIANWVKSCPPTAMALVKENGQDNQIN